MSRPAMQGYPQNPNMYKPRNGPPQQQFPQNGQPNMYQQQPPMMNGYAMQNGNTSPPNSMPMRPPMNKVKDRFKPNQT